MMDSKTSFIGIVYQSSEVGREASQLIKTLESSNRRVSQTFGYGLQDRPKLDDFNQVVDWENSSFYNASTEKLNKTMIY